MSNASNKRSALGKGLGALLQGADAGKEMTGEPGSVSMIQISAIEANPFNPRTHFEKQALEELSQSISIHGIIQPLTVRKVGQDKYQLISGERRFRASQLAGLTEVPAYVRVANDQTMLEMALVENIQREDLNAIEVALSYQRLIDECSLTQDQLSQKVAKSRSSITNFLRLLKLPAEVQAGVRDNQISMGHARALVSAGDEAMQISIYEQVVAHGLSVRDTEALVKGELSPQVATEEKASVKNTQSHTISDTQFVFKEHLSDRLATKVDIKKAANGSGSIVLKFSSENDLNRIIELLNN
ncbi:ParB/RepB/Spo0J family partition protein [Crocinitomicaceae bacterium CZZ-1]|uniref:ParB/RepB/Spo0J family partition protein n=1 Tax=Taishania pollutisoli TaxID=2766479 RepID=A0A8J6TXL0_9FLAO|nr:ParB/RepB/Spo0J family partition protein [Taishania pollutisoli]MBC9812671.1 ParB/RepB/Spo0J family partition protein [Taishania pollutisoli]